MLQDIKTIGVLTSGGDAPGMNAAIRAVVRTALHSGFNVKGILRGFAGIFDEDIIDMDMQSVADIINRGGTILYTARCAEMMTEKGPKEAVRICKKHNIDAIIAIGGDGTFRGAHKMAEAGINVIGIPGTIDLDVPCTEYTIGFDTAVNTAIQAIDKVRDTSASHKRCSIIEVMGRHAGYIALWSGIATGADEILIPEKFDGDEERIIANIRASHERGKNHFIIINAEGIGHSDKLAKKLEKETGIETRVTILGYMQRGGAPSCKDRFYASIMGSRAIDALLCGRENRIIVYENGEFCDLDMAEALAMEKGIPEYQFRLNKRLNR